MHRVLTRWLLNGLITTTVVFGALEARAAVVFGERGLSAGVDLGPWSEATFTADGGRSIGSSLLVIDADNDREPQRDSDPEQFDLSLGHSPLGMANSNTSLSQVTGPGGGSAIPYDLETPLQDSIQAALPPESRTHCPRGPAFRWFRPPRVWL